MELRTEWYYSDNGRQAGPVTGEALQNLAQDGAIKAETLVWRAGFADWVPYSRAECIPAEQAALSAETVFCSECGQPYSTDDLVRFGGRWVCGNCKETFAQKLREGVAPPGECVYAGFWIRVAAELIDAIVLTAASAGVNELVFGAARPASVVAALSLAGLSFLLQMALSAAYEGLFVNRCGATPGKMALRLRVVTPGGGPVSLGRAIGRYFAKLLSGFTLGIGYIMVAFDEQKRGLHDHICATRVIRTVD